MENLIDTIFSHKEEFSHVFPFDIKREEILWLDLSKENSDFDKIKQLSTFKLGTYITDKLEKHNCKYAVGGYLEDRFIYDRMQIFGNGANKRSIHLGIDIWCNEYTPVHSPLHSIVHSFANNSNKGDYGPTIILKHSIEDMIFYSLFGHLSVNSLKNINTGEHICAGEAFAEIGNSTENGGWPSHLHLQLILDIGDNYGNFPGVCSANNLDYFKAICPNPQIILKCL